MEEVETVFFDEVFQVVLPNSFTEDAVLGHVSNHFNDEKLVSLVYLSFFVGD